MEWERHDTHCSWEMIQQKQHKIQNGVKSTAMVALVMMSPQQPWEQDSWGNMGPIWDRQGPGGPHDGPMNFALWEFKQRALKNTFLINYWRSPKNECIYNTVTYSFSRNLMNIWHPKQISAGKHHIWCIAYCIPKQYLRCIDNNILITH